MNLRIERIILTDTGLLSNLYVNGVRECYGLCPHPVNPVHAGHPAIPEGTYDVALTYSPHLKYVTPEILKVPNRTAIRIHIANYPRELLGCTAVGYQYKRSPETMLLESKLAFQNLFQVLYDAVQAGDRLVAQYVDLYGS